MSRRDFDDRPPRRGRRQPAKRGSNLAMPLLIGIGLLVFLAIAIGVGIAFLAPWKKQKPGVEPPPVAVENQPIAPAMPQEELAAGAVVPLPQKLPAPATIPDDPFKERREAFRDEWPRFTNRGQAWNVEPDRMDLSKPFGPQVEFSASRIQEGRYQAFIFPTSPSPFLAVPANFGKKPSATIRDLRTGDQVGAIDGKIDLVQPSDLRLSPDGKWLLAAMVDHFMLHSTDGGEPKRFPAKFRNWFDFGHDANHVLSLVYDAGRQRLIQLNLQTGESRSLREDPPAESTQKTLAYSPNRKILACVSGGSIMFLDSATGKQLGARPSPALTFNKQPPCTAMAFSADGSRWVGAFGGIKHGLYVLDVATGSVVGEFPVPASVGPLTQGHALQMTPDGRGVLLNGQFLFDAKNGALVRDLGVEGKFGRNKLNTGAVLLADWTLVERVEADSNRDMSTARFDRERFEAEILAASDVADTIVRKPVDRKNSASTIVRAAPDWKYKPAESTPKLLPPTFPEGGPIHAFSVNAGSRIASALRSAKNGDDPASRELRIDSVSHDGQSRSFNVGARRPSDSSDFRPEFDASSKFAAFVDPANRGMVIVTPLDGPPSIAIQPGDEGTIEWLAFSGDDLLLTTAGDGRLTAWKLPDARAVWTIKTAAKSAAISSDRKTLAIYMGTRIDLLNAADGDSMGAIGVSEQATEQFRKGTAACAFAGDGKTLIAAFPAGASRAIGRWDLSNGKPIGDAIALPQRALGRVHALGKSFGLIGEMELFDFERKLALCQFVPLANDRSTIAALSPDENLWLIPSGASQAKAIDMPPARAKQVTQSLDAGTLSAVLPRGEAVAIEVKLVGCTAGNADLVREGIAKRLADLLKAKGHTVNAAAAHRIRVTATESLSGEQVELKKIREFFDSPGGTIDLRKIDITLEVSGPKASHRAVSNIRNKIETGRKFPPGDDVDMRLKQELWSNAGDWAIGAADVSHIYGDEKGSAIALPILLGNLE